MAISQTYYAGTEAYLGFAEESTFGTAIADSSNFVLFEPFDGNVPYFNPTFFLDDQIKASGKNMVDVGDKDITKRSATATARVTMKAEILVSLLPGTAVRAITVST